MEKIINKDTATKIIFEKKDIIKPFKNIISTMKNPFYEESQIRKRYVSFLEYKLRNKSKNKRDKIIRRKIAQEGNLRLSCYDILNIDKIFITIIDKLIDMSVDIHEIRKKIFCGFSVFLSQVQIYDKILIENGLPSIYKQIDNEEIIYFNEKYFYNMNPRKYKEFFSKGDEYYIMKLYSGNDIYYEKRLSKEEYLKEKEYFKNKDKYIVEEDINE